MEALGVVLNVNVSQSIARLRRAEELEQGSAHVLIKFTELCAKWLREEEVERLDDLGEDSDYIEDVFGSQLDLVRLGRMFNSVGVTFAYFPHFNGSLGHAVIVTKHAMPEEMGSRFLDYVGVSGTLEERFLIQEDIVLMLDKGRNHIW